MKESPSWTSSYSTTVQGSSPRLESQTIFKNDSELIPAVSEDVPATTQEGDSEPTVPNPVVDESISQVVSSAEVGGRLNVLSCPSV
jgi:hypothetical protein